MSASSIAGARAPSPDEPATDAGPGPRQRVRDAVAINALKARDNHTNFKHIAFVWLVIAIAIAVAVTAWSSLALPIVGKVGAIAITVLAIVVIGASQHQLGGAVHEATHHTLFENRKLNEIASDWLAAFPIYTTTYQFRLHHLAHHQFINDPVRDPDFAQLHDSGHALDFPITHIEMLKTVLKQLWLPNLVRYTITRARYSALSGVENPYNDPEAEGSRWPVRIALLFAIVAPLIFNRIAKTSDGTLVAAAIGGAWMLAMAYYWRAPESHFAGSRLRPVISHRATYMARVSFLALLFSVLSAVQLAGFGPALTWFTVLWIIPLFTTFPFFMIMRQWVQHGNADRGRYTNTRVFLVGPLMRYAVFPFGMDYHLPHHLIASVPHYNLKALHEVLSQDPDYAEKCVIAEGYFGHDDPETGRPTAISVLGERHAPKAGGEVYVNVTALEHVDVKDRAALDRECELSRQAA